MKAFHSSSVGNVFLTDADSLYTSQDKNWDSQHEWLKEKKKTKKTLLPKEQILLIEKISTMWSHNVKRWKYTYWENFMNMIDLKNYIKKKKIFPG